MKQPIKAILFDMDGVLIDSERTWRIVAKNFWQDCGLQELPQVLRDKIYGISVQEEYALVKEKTTLALSFNEYIAMYDKYAAQVYETSRLAENLEGVLTEIAGLGIKKVVVSSSLNSWIGRFKNRLQSPKLFNLYISVADTVELSPKPSPDGYLFALSTLGLSAAECLVIEDSNRGIASGKAAKMMTIASKEFIDSDYQQTGYDQQINNLMGILPLLR